MERTALVQPPSTLPDGRHVSLGAVRVPEARPMLKLRSRTRPFLTLLCWGSHCLLPSAHTPARHCCGIRGGALEAVQIGYTITCTVANPGALWPQLAFNPFPVVCRF